MEILDSIPDYSDSDDNSNDDGPGPSSKTSKPMPSKTTKSKPNEASDDIMMDMSLLYNSSWTHFLQMML